jgi:glutaredoxin 3
MGIVFKIKYIYLRSKNFKKMKNTLFILFFLIGLSPIVRCQENKQQISNKNVMIVYGSDDCHHCIDTKTFLKDNKIEFVFFDIDKNPKALKEMLGKLRNAGISTSSLGIPVVDKQGTIFTNNGIFEEFLKKLK